MYSQDFTSAHNEATWHIPYPIKQTYDFLIFCGFTLKFLMDWDVFIPFIDVYFTGITHSRDSASTSEETMKCLRTIVQCQPIQTHRSINLVLKCSGPLYYHLSPLISAWMCNYIHYLLRDQNSYPFPNINGANDEVRESITHFIAHIDM